MWYGADVRVRASVTALGQNCLRLLLNAHKILVAHYADVRAHAAPSSVLELLIKLHSPEIIMLNMRQQYDGVYS